MDRFTASSQNELLLLPPQLSYSKRNDSSESDEEKNLNDFQRKMRREHLRALAHINKACVFTERIRRKRITVSCNKLRELLPKVQGTRSDMVTVLEMTIAFLENTQEFAKEHQYREILYPPEHLYCRWLVETHLSKQQCQKKSCEEEQVQNGQHQKSRPRKGRLFSPISGQGQRRTDIPSDPNDNLEVTGCSNEPHTAGGDEVGFCPTQLPSEGQSISAPVVPLVPADQMLDMFAAPSFWSPAALMSPGNAVTQSLQATSWDNCTTPVGLHIGHHEDCGFGSYYS